MHGIPVQPSQRHLRRFVLGPTQRKRFLCSGSSEPTEVLLQRGFCSDRPRTEAQKLFQVRVERGLEHPRGQYAIDWSIYKVKKYTGASRCTSAREPTASTLQMSYRWFRIQTLIPIGEDAVYVCAKNETSGAERYFDWNKTMESFGVECLPDGTFENKTWPMCLEHHGNTDHQWKSKKTLIANVLFPFQRFLAVLLLHSLQ